MYNFELKQLDATNAVAKTLQIVENICDEYQLENDFGIISLSLNDILSLIFEKIDKENVEIDANFYITNQSLRIQIIANHSLKNVEQFLKDNFYENSENSLIFVSKLIDKIEFNHENNEIILDYAVKPTFTSINHNREEILLKMKKNIYNKQE